MNKTTIVIKTRIRAYESQQLSHIPNIQNDPYILAFKETLYSTYNTTPIAFKQSKTGSRYDVP